MSRYGRKRISRRDMLKAAGALTAALAALGGGAWLLQRMDREQDRANASDSYTTNDHRAEAELQEIAYNGRTYRQRPGLETYLLMGVDTSGAGLGVNSYAGGGQADVQIVVVLDDANQTWQMLQLNRDSIVQVPVRGVQGDIIAYDNEQLALAYYYGDGREQSCENTVLTVSALLDGQTIDGYAAVNMDAVGIITDMVGGVTLTVSSDFSAIDPTLVEGETVTLYGDQALTYVRSRYNIDDETNIARMARQRQFLAALEEKLRQQDGAFVASAYEELADHMVTSIASGTAAEIAAYLSYLMFPGGDTSFWGWRLYIFGAAGLLAGVLLQRKRLPADEITLGIFTFLAVFIIYGGIMNISTLVTGAAFTAEGFSWEQLKILYLTGVPFDLLHAFRATVFMVLFGNPIIRKLERIKIKYGFYRV